MKGERFYYAIPGIWPGIATVESSRAKMPRLYRLPPGNPDPLIKIYLDINHSKWPDPMAEGWGQFGAYWYIPKQLYLDYQLTKLIRFKLLVVDEGNNALKFLTNQTYWRAPTRIGAEPMAWRQFFIFLQLKLLPLGYTLLPVAAISNGKQSAILAGPPGTGKTATVLLAQRDGYKLISEDTLVTDGVKLYPPMYPGIKYKVYSGAFMSLQKGSENLLKRKLRAVLSRAGLESLARLTLGSRDFMLPNDIVTEPTNISRIFFLQKGGTSDYTTPITREEAKRRLQAIQRADFQWRALPSVFACAFFDPDINCDKLAAQEDVLLDRILDGKEYILCSSPSPFNFMNLIKPLF